MDIAKTYQHNNRYKTTLLVVGLVTILAMGVFSVSIGNSETTVVQVGKALISYLNGEIGDNGVDDRVFKIILLLRFPRSLMAVVTGFGLAIAGVAMQGITQNPLVSPFTVGVSNAAAFGASLSIVLGWGLFPGTQWGIIISAFLVSLVSSSLVFLIAKKSGLRVEIIILTGIALNYFFSAMSSVIQFFAEDYALADVVNWAFGSFNSATWVQLIAMVTCIIPCSCGILSYAQTLNTMSTGETAYIKSIGINTGKVNAAIGIVSVFMTAAIISFTGVIGFVGLVAPHMARLIIGNNYKFLIPFSGIIGAILLLLSDTIGRTILAPVSIPVGIVISIIGVPFFVQLILKKKQNEVI